MKSLVRAVLVGTGIVVAGLLGSANAAQAVPSGCNLQVGVPADGAQVRCSSGTGEVRVRIQCILTKPGGDPIINDRNGAWVGVGSTSSVNCPGGPTLYEAWYEVR
ncbi:hypothetical protein [Jidongwangia harbinensis]|uniref:hypothetical protein n=1 Tax=Jidongwangia harbinensis TaxID=2878561 RepID=UPI001CD9A863|nr:hypothetical protein [Jidongwangia harbinensis]MCA2219285.1 hypothetical protein [Jidongwangia harbinensis]